MPKINLQGTEFEFSILPFRLLADRYWVRAKISIKNEYVNYVMESEEITCYEMEKWLFSAFRLLAGAYEKPRSVAFEKSKIFMKSHNASNADLHQKVKLSHNGESKKFFVHRLVMLAFSPIENPELFQVNHIDGNPLNNTLENLEWVTEKENHKHYKETLIRQRCAEGMCELGAKPKNIKVEFEDGQVNYYIGIEEACAHLQISKSTYLRWKEQGTPVKISYVDIVFSPK